MASSIVMSNCQIVEIQRQITNMSPSSKNCNTKLKRCSCCPYGYHIDLDFIRYCEELANNSEQPTSEQLERRNKRRQRKSLEVMLGFNEDWYSDYERSMHSTEQQELSFQTIYEDFDYLERTMCLPSDRVDCNRNTTDITSNQQVVKAPVWKNSTAQNEFVNEILFDVYKDFLRTFENTSAQTKNDSSHLEATNYLTETNNFHEQNVLTETCEEKIEMVTQYEKYEKTPKSPKPSIDSTVIRIEELSQENHNLSEQLQSIRSQLVDNLNRVRYFEERVKLIPKLELQLSVEQVENRDLHLKLKNLESVLEEKERIESLKMESIKLESFENKIIQLDKRMNVVPTQDASCSTTRTILRDVGILTVPTVIPTNTIGTNTEIESLFDKKAISTSVGIQCDTQQKIQTRHIATSTTPQQNESIGIMAIPSMVSRFCTAKPETKSIGINCIHKKVELRSFGTNPIEQLSTDKPSSSLKLSDLNVPKPSKPLEKQIETISIGTQYLSNVSSKYSQCQLLPEEPEKVKIQTKPQSTTTNDLTLFINRAINTDALPTTKSRLTNTENVITTNKSTNTDMEQAINIKSESSQDIRNLNEHQCHNCLAKIEIKQRTIIANPKKSKIEASNITNINKSTVKNSHIDESTNTIQHVDRQSTVSQSTESRSNKKITRQNTYTISSSEIESSQKSTTNQSTSCPAEFVLSQNVCTKATAAETPNVKNRVISDFASASHVGTSEEVSTTETVEINRQQSVDADNEVLKLWGPSMKSSSTYSQLASSSKPRQKVTPSKEMQAALKVINDSLLKGQHLATTLKNANKIVQKEWFRISSTEDSQPFGVEDYLDCFEEYSPNVLKYVVNLTDANGNTAMHYAVSHGNFDIVSILLDSKVCEINNTNNAGYTCVMLVSLVKLDVAEHRSVVQRLFQIADVNVRAKKHSQTALMLATSHGNYNMVCMLLEAGADINIQDEDGSTALMCAAEHGRMDIIKILLAHPDCDSTIQDLDGSTALKISLDAGYRDIGVLLYAHEYMIKNKSPYASLQSSGAINRKHSTSLSSSTNISNTKEVNAGPSSTKNKETCES